eukprot:g6168.t1
MLFFVFFVATATANNSFRSLTNTLPTSDGGTNGGATSCQCIYPEYPECHSEEYKECKSVTTSDGVTKIEANAFEDDFEMTTMIVGNGVTEIGARAFNNLFLESVTLPDTLTTIGEKAFQGCRELDKLVLPGTLTTIGESAFENCTLLGELVTVVGGIERYRLPENVKTIGKNAFKNTEMLTEMLIEMKEMQNTPKKGGFEEDFEMDLFAGTCFHGITLSDLEKKCECDDSGESYSCKED